MSEHYVIDQREGKDWVMYHGDSCEVIKGIPTESVDFTVYSPPFASLYVYSDSMRDLGNCVDHAQFYEHFTFLAGELLRVTKPGRLLSFHCMQLPTSKSRDGYIGLTDFRGILTKVMQDAGWIYHSEVCIWKDPVTAMQRTHALGLLYKQLRKDSCMSRQGIPDYLVTMRKPGINAVPVPHEDYARESWQECSTCEGSGELTRDVAEERQMPHFRELAAEVLTIECPPCSGQGGWGTGRKRTGQDFSVDQWQKWASPVWMDINPQDTLQKRSAREEEDERHICPLQLEVIRRALVLWSNPGDLVLSPFGGIGSEGYVSLQEGRQFVGVELKKSYWLQACNNLEAISVGTKKQLGLAL